MSVCSVCGLGLVNSEKEDGICFSCKNKQAENEVKQFKRSETNRLNKILLTTETNPDLKVKKRLEIISAECAFGINIFRDFFVAVRDVFGGRSKPTQKVLRDARKKVLEELRLEAFELEANAVIAVRLEYSQMSSQNNNMLFVAETGTAVIIEEE